MSDQTEPLNMDALFVLDDVRFYPTDRETGVVFNRRNCKTLKLPIREYHIARECAELRSLEQHVDEIFRKKGGKEDKTHLREVLKGVVEAGLTLSAKDVLTQLQSQEEMQEQTDWRNGWILAVGSADRPQLLARLLDSLSPYIRDIDVKPTFIMVDDSRRQVNQQQNQSAFQAFCAEYRLESEYIDREQRATLALTLKNRLPTCATSIDYLLSPTAHSDTQNTIGQVRNLILLKAAGKPLLMLDDDSVISPLKSKDYSADISLGDHGRNTHPEKNYLVLRDKLVDENINPLVEHLAVLGKSVGDVVKHKYTSLLKRENWHGLHREQLFEINSNQRFAMSINAIAGALNARQMNWFYISDGETLLRSAQFIDAIEEGESIEQAMWIGARCDEVSRDINLICTTISGIDALPLLPPMPPVGRNEDVALGQILKYIFTDTQVMRFGWGIPHRPEPVRRWEPLATQDEPVYDSNRFLLAFIDDIQMQCSYGEAKDRLLFLASQLNCLTRAEALSFARQALYKHHASQAYLHENTATEAAAYPKYQAGCKKMVNYHMQQIGQLDQDMNNKVEAFVYLAKLYARSIQDWLVIWDCFLAGEVTGDVG
ncbi:MAG: hypothetical protein MI754_01265 [Chromatiales bacterium]|nr:hypothetical protein [Chromatiales bacterium]